MRSFHRTRIHWIKEEYKKDDAKEQELQCSFLIAKKEF